MRLDEERLQDILEAIEAIERHMPKDKQTVVSRDLQPLKAGVQALLRKMEGEAQ
ncbi:MAG: hypothetical protein AB1768_15010 [Pseudomonadota bacterium]|jgi:uncharacterized protein with HEPN domain